MSAFGLLARPLSFEIWRSFCVNPTGLDVLRKPCVPCLRKSCGRSVVARECIRVGELRAFRPLCGEGIDHVAHDRVGHAVPDEHHGEFAKQLGHEPCGPSLGEIGAPEVRCRENQVRAVVILRDATVQVHQTRPVVPFRTGSFGAASTDFSSSSASTNRLSKFVVTIRTPLPCRDSAIKALWMVSSPAAGFARRLMLAARREGMGIGLADLSVSVSVRPGKAGQGGNGVCDDPMKPCLSSSGCETRPAKGEPARPVASLAPETVTVSAKRRHASEWAVGR